MDKQELKQEEINLKKTREVIKKELESNQQKVLEKETNIYEINNYIWKNVSSLSSNLDVLEQRFLENENLREHNLVLRNVKKISALQKAYHSSYFGRVDFDNEKYYIGITSVDSDGKYYVYDWRTPIASLFYNNKMGDVYYETPIDKIHGCLSLKRQYKIIDDNIVRCFDSNLNIDDEYLQEILTKQKDDKMTNIVNTIQADQNKIIRDTANEYLIVEGCAGSGKTSVALHHIAYLLYKYKNLTSNNILILSPSKVFSKYISNVLPELGEDNVLSTTFDDLTGKFLNEFDKIEGYSEYLEKIYSNSYDNNIRFKQDDKIIDILNNFMEEFSNNLEFIKGFKYKNSIVRPSDLNDYFKNRCNNLSITDKMNKLFDRFKNILGVKKVKEKEAIKELLFQILNYDLDIVSIYNKFIDYINEKYNYNFEYITKEFLSYEDSILVLYLKLELFNYPHDIYIKQIVIDEAQDYSLLQYEIFKKIFYKSEFTILGDANQTINKYKKIESLKSVSKVFNNAKYVVLNKTYRSSKEIIDYTNKILNINNVCSIQKHNNIPIKNIVSKKPAIALLKELEELNDKKIAIITKNGIVANKLRKILDKNNIKSNIYNKMYDKEENIVIIPAYLSKGLEFENVIVYSEFDDGYKENDKYLYYVVCTRAQSRLILINNN